jgi:hypothetical protein
LFVQRSFFFLFLPSFLYAFFFSPSYAYQRNYARYFLQSFIPFLPFLLSHPYSFPTLLFVRPVVIPLPFFLILPYFKTS